MWSQELADVQGLHNLAVVRGHTWSVVGSSAGEWLAFSLSAAFCLTSDEHLCFSFLRSVLSLCSSCLHAMFSLLSVGHDQHQRKQLAKDSSKVFSQTQADCKQQPQGASTQQQQGKTQHLNSGLPMSLLSSACLPAEGGSFGVLAGSWLLGTLAMPAQQSFPLACRLAVLPFSLQLGKPLSCEAL